MKINFGDRSCNNINYDLVGDRNKRGFLNEFAEFICFYGLPWLMFL